MKATSPARIRVLVVDDHTMVRRGLATFLKAFDDLELVGEARDGKEAVDFCRQKPPDVVLMDMTMPEMDGTTATHLIRKQTDSIRVIALTSFKEESMVQSALQAGAIGYLLKNVSAEELAQAIRAAHAGHSVLSPEVAEVMVHAANQPPIPGYDLTKREGVVLALMVEGLNNTQIASKLFVSPSTIKSHVSNILSKLGVSSRTEAVTQALRNGLIK